MQLLSLGFVTAESSLSRLIRNALFDKNVLKLIKQQMGPDGATALLGSAGALAAF